MKLHRWISNAHRGGKPDYLALTVPGGQGLKLDIEPKAQSSTFSVESLDTALSLLKKFIRESEENSPEFVFCRECEFRKFVRPYPDFSRAFCELASIYIPPSWNGCCLGRRKGT